MSPLNEAQQATLKERFPVSISRLPSGYVQIIIKDIVQSRENGEDSGKTAMFSPNNPEQANVIAQQLSDSLLRDLEGVNMDEVIPFFMGIIMQALQSA